MLYKLLKELVKSSKCQGIFFSSLNRDIVDEVLAFSSRKNNLADVIKIILISVKGSKGPVHETFGQKVFLSIPR